MNDNFILNTDSYKVPMFEQYPPDTEYVSSYIEARGTNDVDYSHVVMGLLQMYIKQYLTVPVTRTDVYEAKEIYDAHGEPFNFDGWMYIVNNHGGYLPIEIEAIPEGTIAPLQTALVQIKNTDPKVPWLTTWVETSLLRAIWYSSTVATNSWTIKKAMKEVYDETGSVQGLDFKLHDFGARGVSSNESAMIGGLSHLMNFKGTDTVAALVAGRRYYNERCAGFSIPAAEHSTITAWGKENEVAAYRNMLAKFGKPGKLVAVVSDSYDIYNAAQNIWGIELKQEVIDSGATVVVRPDSGNAEVVPIEIIEILMHQFGYTTNEKGYRTLPDNIRVIQGDGINRFSIKTILANLKQNRMTVDNLAFGMGGAMLQGTENQTINRDTLKFAMKASAICINGEWRDVYKDPITDKGKVSKRGILDTAINDEGVIKTFRKGELPEGFTSIMRTVFRNGKLLIEEDFSTIRERVIV